MVEAAMLIVLAMMLVTTVTVVRLQNLFAAVMLNGISSLLAATFFVLTDAVDVAFTEAAVGAGVATVLMLATLALVTDSKRQARSSQVRRRSKIPALLITVLVMLLLVYASLDMPGVGDANSPAQQHLAQQFLTNAEPDTHIPNVVTVVLASYRGYDTLGETAVIFTACTAVLLLIGASGRRHRRRTVGEITQQVRLLTNQIVLRVAVKLFTPVILLFALYVQFHGDYGPGGGFQAGVIFGAGIILYALVFGLDNARHVVLQRYRILRALVAVGLLLYGGVGVVTMLLGGEFLNYSVLAHERTHAQHIGILLVELGVGITVAAVMIAVFLAFAGRGQREVGMSLNRKPRIKPSGSDAHSHDVNSNGVNSKNVNSKEAG